MPKVLHNTTKIGIVAQYYILAPSSFTYAIILLTRENMSKISHSLGTMVTLLVVMALNKLIVTCLGS